MPDNVKGEARLKATLRAASAAMAGPGLADAARQAESVMVRSVKARTPRRSGALAASVRPASVGTPGAGRTAAVESALTYAAPIEYGVGPRRGQRGGHNIRAARMFAEGAADAEGPAVEAAADAVRKIMRRVKGA
jgi:hypothetical protein